MLANSVIACRYYFLIVFELMLFVSLFAANPGCYYADTSKFNCYGYPGCGYTCVGINCAYAGSTCKCDCNTCANFYSDKCLDSKTGTCTIAACGTFTPSATPTAKPTAKPTASPSVKPTGRK